MEKKLKFEGGFDKKKRKRIDKLNLMRSLERCTWTKRLSLRMNFSLDPVLLALNTLKRL